MFIVICLRSFHMQFVVAAITRRKIENTDEEIVRAINRYLLCFAFSFLNNIMLVSLLL